jgi:predicted RND superfamily exporter protein
MGGYRVGNDLSQWSGKSLEDGQASSAVILGWEPVLTAEAQAALIQEIKAIGAVTAVTPSEALLVGALSLTHITENKLQGVLLQHDPQADRGELLDAIRTACRNHQLTQNQFYLSGPTAISTALDEWSQRGLQQASILILLVGFVGVWVSTRRLIVSLLTCLAVYASQVILMGAWAWSGRPVDMMLSAVPPLMMALGFSFALHRATRRNIFLPMFLCGITTAAGFLTLAITSTPAIRGFALWGAVGIALVWTSVMVLVPSGTLRKPEDQIDNVTNTRRFYLNESMPFVLILAVVISLLAVPSFWSIRVSDNPLLELPANATIREDTQQIDQRLMGTLPSRVVMPKEIGLTTQSLSHWPEVLQVIPQPDTDAGHHAWLLLNKNHEPAGLAQAMNPYLEHGAQWTGPAAQVIALAHSVKTTAVFSIPIMLVLIWIVLYAICRDLVVAMVGAWVCLLPVLALVALVGVLNQPVGLTALMTGAIALGVAVDDTIHLLSAASEYGVARAWQSCQKPCLHSSLIAAGCALCLQTVPFKPTATFGLLLAVSILAAVLADLLVLPAGLSRLSLRRGRNLSKQHTFFGVQPA